MPGAALRGERFARDARPQAGARAAEPQPDARVQPARGLRRAGVKRAGDGQLRLRELHRAGGWVQVDDHLSARVSRQAYDGQPRDHESACLGVIPSQR